MTQGLKGKVALITGAGTGIGLATAQRFAAEGATVVAGIVGPEQASAVTDFDARELDVRDEAAWDRALAHIEETHGGLDILVNSAGIHRLGIAEDTSAAMWDEVMAINLWGTFAGCKKAIPALRRRGGGSIVNLASINAIKGVAGMAAYNASKGGIRAMTMGLALEVARQGIRVNCVCPGAVDTPIMEGILAQAGDVAAMRQTIKARHPMDRISEPEEIAAAIAFLASDDASYITGLAMPVDGGRSIV